MKRKTSEIFCRTKTTQNKKQKTNLKKIQHRKLRKRTKWTSSNIRRGKPRCLLLIFISTDPHFE